MKKIILISLLILFGCDDGKSACIFFSANSMAGGDTVWLMHECYESDWSEAKCYDKARKAAYRSIKDYKSNQTCEDYCQGLIEKDIENDQDIYVCEIYDVIDNKILHRKSIDKTGQIPEVLWNKDY